MPRFERYWGIDYSGAETPTRSLPGLRLYAATLSEPPVEIPPPPSPRKYWTRQGLALWMEQELRCGPPTLVGIDHAFSFPLAYFQCHGIPLDWPTFLEDFQKHWPTQENLYVDFIREGRYGMGQARSGHARWRRLTEERCRAKSVFHFDVQGSVAKSTHSGLPWLNHLRKQLGSRLHFWPFAGWTPASGCSVLAEVYPALWNRLYPRESRNDHQQDAYAVARWLQESDRNGSLSAAFDPQLAAEERNQAKLEGWILGLPGGG
jgi:hypothetical protein